MENPHQRKKDPERVRQLILDHAIQLAAKHGVQGMSIQNVATLAGVTKRWRIPSFCQ
ncbi:TetR/AcrR family transcriptional regulator [Acinetobacter piscicola]|uniref:TetR/AcrR family transcriptional regulator n=1 Tax=Acinetobacter piscicola TaxID=2006115 RepID=UPI001E5F5AA0|nr:TetR family transcriptional regulator [Acinetobacter piscicola]